MKQEKTDREVPLDVRFPGKEVSRAEAKKAFENLRAQAADLPEITLEEINAEISAARAEKRLKM